MIILMRTLPHTQKGTLETLIHFEPPKAIGGPSTKKKRWKRGHTTKPHSLPVILMARCHHKVNTTFLSLYFPLMNPFRHLPSRIFTTHIHRRHHLGPIERHGETRELVEGRVFRVRDTIDLNG